MGRARTNLGRQHPEGLAEPFGRRLLRPVWLVFAWILLWIPISIVWPFIHHFHHAFVTPLLFPISLLGGAFTADDFLATYLPAGIFWFGLLAGLALTPKLRRRSGYEGRL